MADPPNIESQIDCFLEQFKRSASKAMEERSGNNITVSPIVRSRSFYLEVETPGEFMVTEKCLCVFLHLRRAGDVRCQTGYMTRYCVPTESEIAFIVIIITE